MIRSGHARIRTVCHRSLEVDRRTTVATKIAAIATREASGVDELGKGSARAMGQLRQRIPGSSGPSERFLRLGAGQPYVDRTMLQRRDPT